MSHCDIICGHCNHRGSYHGFEVNFGVAQLKRWAYESGRSVEELTRNPIWECPRCRLRVKVVATRGETHVIVLRAGDPRQHKEAA